MTKVAKKAKLNVSDKDSPYALIDKYFPERESYFYQNKDKFVEEYRGQETKTDIGNISPSEVNILMLMLRRYGGVIGLQMMMKWVKVALGMDGGRPTFLKELQPLVIIILPL